MFTCRGYKSLHEAEEVLEKMIQNDIPMDALWLDIDYMNTS